MKSFKLQMNNNIEIKVGKDFYKCTIQDVQKEFVLINLPVKDGIYLTLDVGQGLIIYCYQENIGYFQFDSRVIGRVIENRIPCYKIAEPSNVKKTNRRSFVRVDFSEEITYIIANEKNKRHKGILLDLSGGGARIKTYEKLKLGAILIIDLMIDKEVIKVECKIRRNVGYDNKEFLYGIEFLEINERLRDRIINKVFNQMRKVRKREL